MSGKMCKGEMLITLDEFGHIRSPQPVLVSGPGWRTHLVAGQLRAHLPAEIQVVGWRRFVIQPVECV